MVSRNLHTLDLSECREVSIEVLCRDSIWEVAYVDGCLFVVFVHLLNEITGFSNIL
jgi:hypothetical protein